MTPPDRADLADRARGLLEDARAVEAGVDSAASELLRLGGDVARAGTPREAARLGAQVAAERELMSGLLDELVATAASADQLDAELAQASGDGIPRDVPCDRPGTDARSALGAVRQVVQTARSRGRETVWIGELATSRVRDLAEFDLLHSRARRHLSRHDFEAAEAVLPQLVALDRALLNPEVSLLLDELRFRLLTDRD